MTSNPFVSMANTLLFGRRFGPTVFHYCFARRQRVKYRTLMFENIHSEMYGIVEIFSLNSLMQWIETRLFPLIRLIQWKEYPIE